MSDTVAAHQHVRFDPLCLILGWVLPGLGYFRVGQRRRGVRVMSGVLFLVFIGVLVGGVDVVDRHEDHLWFIPQMLIGPLAFGVDYLNVTFVKNGTTGMQSLGRVNEIGTLYVALAGLMNLATMLDCATRNPAREQRRAGDSRRRAREDNPEFVERRESQRESSEQMVDDGRVINAPDREDASA